MGGMRRRLSRSKRVGRPERGFQGFQGAIDGPELEECLPVTTVNVDADDHGRWRRVEVSGAWLDAISDALFGGSKPEEVAGRQRSNEPL